jgi:hypothetical protein
MAGRTWMTDTKAIHQSLLQKICLPSSHDSGTYALKDLMSAQYGSWVQQLVNLLEKVAGALNAIPWLNKLINPAAWVTTAAIPAVKGLATATTRTVAQQLTDGIRCLDLRMTYFSGDKQFYTYHGLLGSKITDVLADIKAFLQSTNGEIVYITMGHWAGFGSNQNLYDQFSTLVSNELGAWAYVPQFNGTVITNNPFGQTYTQIINQGGTAKSRVILVNGQSTLPVFWPLAYSPPDNGPNEGNPAYGTVIAGYYTDTTTLNTMLQTQKQQQQSASLPFALYMTLTPQGSDYAEVVVSSLSGALAKLGVTMLAVPFIGPALCLAIEAVAAGLYIGNLTFSWRTLEQLSAQVDDQLTDLVYKNFATPGQPSNISFLYLDFYERTSAVSLAVALSVANAPSAVPQLPVVGVNQYSTNLGGTTRYFFNQTGGSGWTLVQSSVFRGYSKQTGQAIPVYSLYQTNAAGWNFCLSTSGTPPQNWGMNGVAFYAFTEPSPGLAPVYQYTASNPSFGTMYYYSTVPQVSGWGSRTLAFYALCAPLIPIYAGQASSGGQTRYNWSASSAFGGGWSPGSVVFQASQTQQGDAVPVYQYYQVLGGGWNFMLSMSDTAPQGFQPAGLLCYGFPSSQPGLAPIREFSQTSAGFGTIYQYQPAARLPGWTAGQVLFYAALPQPGDRPGDVNVLDLAALAMMEPT